MSESVVPDDLATHLAEAAADAYAEVAAITCFSPESIAYRGFCTEIAGRIASSLKGVHYDAVSELHVRGEDEHVVTRIQLAGISLIADYTWKQFFRQVHLPEGAPNGIVGERQEVIEKLRAYGANERLLQLWAEDTIHHGPQIGKWIGVVGRILRWNQEVQYR